jgi:hypothetical protein
MRRADPLPQCHAVAPLGGEFPGPRPVSRGRSGRPRPSLSSLYRRPSFFLRDCSSELAAGAPAWGGPEAPYTPIATPSTGTRRAAGPPSSTIALVIRIREAPYTTVGGTSAGRSTDLLFILLRDKTAPPPGPGGGGPSRGFLGCWLGACISSPPSRWRQRPLERRAHHPGNPSLFPRDGDREGPPTVILQLWSLLPPRPPW